MKKILLLILCTLFIFILVTAEQHRKGTPCKIWEGNNGDLDPLILNGYKAFGGYLTIPNKNRRE